jgi:hypothetical protein
MASDPRALAAQVREIGNALDRLLNDVDYVATAIELRRVAFALADAVEASEAELTRLRGALGSIAQMGTDCPPGLEPASHYRAVAWGAIGAAARALHVEPIPTADSVASEPSDEEVAQELAEEYYWHAKAKDPNADRDGYVVLARMDMAVVRAALERARQKRAAP